MDRLNEFDLLNDVEINLADYETVKMSEFEKQKALRKFRKSKHSARQVTTKNNSWSKAIGLVVAALLTLTFLQPNFVQEISATVLNALDEIRITLTQSLYGANKEADSLFLIEESETLGDIPLKLSDIYISGNILTYQLIAYYPDGDERTGKLYFDESQILINGQVVAVIPSEEVSGFDPENPEVFTSTNSYYLPDGIDLSGNLIVDLEFTDIHYHDDSQKEVSTQSGTVKFSVETTGTDVTADTILVETDAIITTDIAEFTFEEIALNPDFTRILIRAEMTVDNSLFYDYAYRLQATSESGDVLDFIQWNSSNEQADGSYLIEFRVDQSKQVSPITLLDQVQSMDIQLLRYDGLKAPVEEFEAVGEPVTIEL